LPNHPSAAFGVDYTPGKRLCDSRDARGKASRPCASHSPSACRNRGAPITRACKVFQLTSSSTGRPSEFPRVLP
jgi:hypothetical protein